MAIGPEAEDDLYKIDSGILGQPITVVTEGGKDVGDSVSDLIKEIPEGHIVHKIPGNISANMKYLLFSWEEKNPGWIKETFLSEKKKIRFYGQEEVMFNCLVSIKRWTSLETSTMPPANAMPGNTFDEKRENLDLLLKTFQS